MDTYQVGELNTDKQHPRQMLPFEKYCMLSLFDI